MPRLACRAPNRTAPHALSRSAESRAISSVSYPYSCPVRTIACHLGDYDLPCAQCHSVSPSKPNPPMDPRRRSGERLKPPSAPGAGSRDVHRFVHRSGQSKPAYTWQNGVLYIGSANALTGTVDLPYHRTSNGRTDAIHRPTQYLYKYLPPYLTAGCNSYHYHCEAQHLNYQDRTHDGQHGPHTCSHIGSPASNRIASRAESDIGGAIRIAVAAIIFSRPRRVAYRNTLPQTLMRAQLHTRRSVAATAPSRALGAMPSIADATTRSTVDVPNRSRTWTRVLARTAMAIRSTDQHRMRDTTPNTIAAPGRIATDDHGGGTTCSNRRQRISLHPGT